MPLAGGVALVGLTTAVSDGAEKVQYRDVTVTVKRVLFTRGGEPTTVVVQETGWVDGQSAENVDLPGSKVGDEGYYFLQADVPGKDGYPGRREGRDPYPARTGQRRR